MKFLVDVGIGKKVENWLKENGFDVLSVRDIDSHAKDSQVIKKILAEYYDKIESHFCVFQDGRLRIRG